MSMKKVKSVLGMLIIVCMLLSLVPISAYAKGSMSYPITDEYLMYRLNGAGTGAVIGGFKDGASTANLVIPSTVTYQGNTYPVYAFDTTAFSNETVLKTVVMPDSITAVLDNVFYGCTNLTSVRMSPNITGTLRGTFVGCNALKTVVVPAGVTDLEKTFGNTSSSSGVRNVILVGTTPPAMHPGSSSQAWSNSIGTGALNMYYPASGTAPTVAGGNATPTVTSYEGFTDGWVYSTNATGAILRTTSNTGALTIPDTLGGKNVYYIKENCFRGLTAITSVVMSDNVTTLEPNTFQNCTSLTSVQLSANLTSGNSTTNSGVLKGTFLGCPIKTIVIPAGITEFQNTFSSTALGYSNPTGCEDRTIILNSMTTNFNASKAGDNAGLRPFANDSTFAVIAPVGATVTDYVNNGGPNIVGRIRYYNSDFLWMENGNNVTVFGPAYTGNKDGGRVTLSGLVTMPSTLGSKNVTEIAAQAFNGQSAITSLALPNTVTTIGDQAFMEMDGLTSFDMPDSVTTIGYGLFYGCNNLANVKLSKNLTGTMQTTFAYCPSLTGCVIPSGVTTLNKTFMYCNAIKTVYVPASVTTITGDTNTENCLFSTFNTNGTITGAPTEPGFVVMGAAGSAIDTYITGKGWNFVAIDSPSPLALTSPLVHSNNTVTVDVVNPNGTDQLSQMIVFSAYYDKTDNSLVDVGFEPLNRADAVSVEHMTIVMQGAYNALNHYARAFVWKIANLEPMATYSELNE